MLVDKALQLDLDTCTTDGLKGLIDCSQFYAANWWRSISPSTHACFATCLISAH